MNGGRSWYSGRTFRPHYSEHYIGMRDGFDRGDFGRGSVMIVNSGNTQFIKYENARDYQRNSPFGNNRSFGEGNRNIDRPRSFGGGNRNIDRPRSFDNGNYETARSRSFGQESAGNNRVRSFGQSSTRTTVGYGSGMPQREFGGSETRRSFFDSRNSRSNNTFGGGHFGGASQQSTFTRSFGSSSRSFGESDSSMTGRSFGGGNSNASTRSFGSSSNSGGGGHFGGRK